MRAPAVEGQFYPRRKNDLKEQLTRCFANLPLTERPVLGGVVPHAGYIYSGITAAHVYSVLPKAETFILLGPNHTGYGMPVSVSREIWSTPFGEVKSDLGLQEGLSRGIIQHDESAHLFEHSIEVQLPFLQHRFGEFEIVPICMGDQGEKTATSVGKEIAEAVRSTHKKVVILASSDFSHYKPDRVAREDDAYFIKSILDMDIPGFYLRLYEREASVCGYGPIAAMLAATKALGARRATLLKYSTSGDTAGDISAVVGYAGIIVE